MPVAVAVSRAVSVTMRLPLLPMDRPTSSMSGAVSTPLPLSMPPLDSSSSMLEAVIAVVPKSRSPALSR